MNPRPLESARDADLHKATAALVRAGQRARQLARQTQTAVVTWKNGKVVRSFPHRDEDDRAA